jgi:hypothetical protein
LFFIVPLISLIFYVAIDLFMETLTFESSVIFSWQTVFFLFIPLLLIYVLAITAPVVLHGRELPFEYGYLAIKVMIVGLLVGLIASVAYGFYFTSQLEQRGYIPCRGVPSGYMPGMGKQYVTDISLCR